MKDSISKTLAAICLIATLSSCGKDEQVNLKPAKVIAEPADDYGYVELGDGELYWPAEGLTTYFQVKEKFLNLSKPLSLAKYENGTLLDSACNPDIALRFDSKGRKSFNKLWGMKPNVANEQAAILTFNVD